MPPPLVARLPTHRGRGGMLGLLSCRLAACPPPLQLGWPLSCLGVCVALPECTAGPDTPQASRPGAVGRQVTRAQHVVLHAVVAPLPPCPAQHPIPPRAAQPATYAHSQAQVCDGYALAFGSASMHRVMCCALLFCTQLFASGYCVPTCYTQELQHRQAFQHRACALPLRTAGSGPACRACRP